MSNGYIVTVEADLEAAREIAGGFGLEVFIVSALGDRAAAAEALASAANIGLLLTPAAAQDGAFAALMRELAQKLRTAQLIVASAEARAAFSYLPPGWPTMPLDEARTRARAAAQGRGEQRPAAPEPAKQETQSVPAPPPQDAGRLEPAEPEPPVSAAPPPTLEPKETERGITLGEEGADERDSFGGAGDGVGGASTEDAIVLGRAEPELPPAKLEEASPPAADAASPAPAPAAQPEDQAQPAPPPTGAPAGEVESARTHSAAPPQPRRREAAASQSSAPADATAFAPKKLRRSTPEMVRISVHQPKDLAAVIKAARRIDPRTEPAPSGMSIGEVALGANVGVSLEVKGAACDGALQRRTWRGEPIDFSFAIEADADVEQAVIMARVFVDDAQIGVIGFIRPVVGADKKPQQTGEKARLKRHKRVFLSYSSEDRETVSAIAVAYQMAGVAHFWDRTSLKSGEEWHPRLRREIDRADLFHLCWSKSAAQSRWVEREAEYALTRRRRGNGKSPDITVQMLDGPPWAPHPRHLDSINFDDFVRAAIVGYARGEE